MKVVFKVRVYVCGLLMLCSAMGSAALTLGRAEGAVFVGKPLDLRVQMQADTGEELQAGCMGAEVFYGETLVDPSRVTVSIDGANGNAGRAPAARVTASVLVNEPIVTVNLRVGCQQKSSRRYTLFPEVATNVVEPATRPTTARSVAKDVVLPVLTAAPKAVGVPAASKRDRLAGPVAKPTSSPVAPVSATRSAPRSAPAAAKTRGKSRLTLDTLDLSMERDPVLRTTPELLTLPQDNAALRAQAAALWRSLNASPEELLLEEAKTKAFEKDLKSLYAVTAENQKGLMNLVGRVQQAESERYANALVYTLAAICLLLLIGLVWVWRQYGFARPTSWMQGADDAQDSLLAELVKSPPVSRQTAPAHLAPTPSPSSPVKPSPVRPSPIATPAKEAPPAESLPSLDFDLGDFELDPEPTRSPERVEAPDTQSLAPAVSHPAHPPPLASSYGGGRDQSAGISGGLRTVDSAELLDVRQTADFFLALGEHQKAIDVLTTRIAQVGESSPLVCLDLLKIYHKLGRESEFEFMRQEFNNWFTGRVPVIDDFGNEGRSLEKYPKVIDQIVALWPDPRVLEYIENCIYHHSTDVYEPDFDLLAYRELLLLHGIAKRIVRLTDDASDSQAASLVRIAARAPSGAPSDASGGVDVAHRVGAQHRGAWMRNSGKSAQTPDPDADVDSRGMPLTAIRLPPVPIVEHDPNAVTLATDDGDAPEGTSDFDFLSLR